MKRKVFLYVGHENWGKSETLRKITHDDKKKKIVELSVGKFFVKKTADESKLLSFVRTMEDSKYNNHVLAFCPIQLKSFDSLYILRTLQKFSKLFFYVQQKSSRCDGEVSDEEIGNLTRFGKVCVNPYRESTITRADKFIKYVEDQFLKQESNVTYSQAKIVDHNFNHRQDLTLNNILVANPF